MKIYFTIPKKMAHSVIVLRNGATDPDLRFLDQPPFLVTLPKPFWVSPFFILDKPDEFFAFPRPCL